MFHVHSNPRVVNQFQSLWESPSNIALVKYWGKKPEQLPANTSISLTLNNCKTTTSVNFSEKINNQSFEFEFLFDGQPKESFKPKLIDFFNRIVKYCPYLPNYQMIISSQNSFPHSSGIASSASAMAALALNIMSLEKQLYPEMSEDYFFQKASFLARLGSGSASRSVKGQVVLWGNHPDVKESSDLYGIELKDIHPLFQTYQDTILIVDKGQKTVSSSVGHNLMHNHPYASLRFAQAQSNITTLLQILKTGDINNFIALVESEALTLHSMMMTSMPYFILMKPQTIAIIEALWVYRKETQIPLSFTLDAGVNVHLLYPLAYINEVSTFIEQNLKQYCENGQTITDSVGLGSKQLG